MVQSASNLEELVCQSLDGTVRWRRTGWDVIGGGYREYYTPLVASESKLLVRTVREHRVGGSFTNSAGSPTVVTVWSAADLTETFHDVYSLFTGTLLQRSKLGGPTLYSHQDAAVGDRYYEVGVTTGLSDFPEYDYLGDTRFTHQASKQFYFKRGLYAYAFSGSGSSKSYERWTAQEVVTERDTRPIHSETRATLSTDQQTIIFAPHWVKSGKTGGEDFVSLRNSSGVLVDTLLGEDYKMDEHVWICGYDWNLDPVFVHEVAFGSAPLDVNFSNIVSISPTKAVMNMRIDNVGKVRTINLEDGSLVAEASFPVQVNSPAGRLHEGLADEPLWGCSDFLLGLDRHFLLTFNP